MKHTYTLILTLFSLWASAQDSAAQTANQPEVATNFKLYPNPAYGDEIYITTLEPGKKEIKIFNVFGEIVLNENILSNSLNIARISPGIYVLQVQQNDKKMTRKLVIK